MMQGIKRNRKKDIVQEAIFPVPPRLSGGIFIFGKIGSGKTTAMLSLAQKYHDHPERRNKIFDLWGGERNEHHYWALPSKDLKYWEKVKKKFKLKDDGPKQYKVNFLYPMCRKLPKHLPEDQPNIKSKVFTIPFKDITIEDISFIIGPPSRENTTIWKELLEKTKKSDTGIDLQYKAEKMGASKYGVYKSFISPLVREGVLQSQNFDYNIDLIAEMKDRDTITVLCLDFVDIEYKLFFLGWFIRNINEALDRGKSSTKTISIIREASKFFRISDQSVVEDRYKVFRSFLSESIRMARRGHHLFLEAQSPAETRGIVDGQQDLTILGKMPSEADREVATMQLKRDNLITAKQVTDLGMLNPGEYYICETSKKAQKRYFFLPRTMYWREGYGNFIDKIWKNLKDSWKNTDAIKDFIIEQMKLSLVKIREQEKMQEIKKRQQEEKAKLAKERERQEEQERKDKLKNVKKEKQKINKPEIIISQMPETSNSESSNVAPAVSEEYLW